MPRYPSDSAAAVSVPPKDPDSVIDYVWDWRARSNTTDPQGTDWLAPGETISSHTVTADSGLTVDSSATTSISTHDGKGNTISLTDNTAVRAFLSGGTAGLTYTVRCRIVTSAGRTEDRSISVRVDEK